MVMQRVHEVVELRIYFAPRQHVKEARILSNRINDGINVLVLVSLQPFFEVRRQDVSEVDHVEELAVVHQDILI